MSMSFENKMDLCHNATEIDEKWQIMHFIDPFFEKEIRGVIVRRIKPRCEMSSNDLCFCGSGRKRKKCHPDVNENSVVANLLSVYNQIDKEISQVSYSICKKGCSDCCRDYFKISAVEFFAILRYLNINYSKEQLRTVISECSRLSEETDFAKDDYFNIPNLAPCVFLDDTTDECKIYEVRPILCRTYGYYQGLTRCPKVFEDKTAIQALLPYHDKKEFVENIDTLDFRGQSLQPKPQAIAYWFSKLENPTNRFLDLSIAASERDTNDFIRILML